MSLMSKVAQFARSPQGRRTGDQAKRWVSDPANRRKIEQIRTRFASRRPGR
jgi:hypothetical protein